MSLSLILPPKRWRHLGRPLTYRPFTKCQICFDYVFKLQLYTIAGHSTLPENHKLTAANGLLYAINNSSIIVAFLWKKTFWNIIWSKKLAHCQSNFQLEYITESIVFQLTLHNCFEQSHSLYLTSRLTLFSWVRGNRTPFKILCTYYYHGNIFCL